MFLAEIFVTDFFQNYNYKKICDKNFREYIFGFFISEKTMILLFKNRDRSDRRSIVDEKMSGSLKKQ